MVVFNSRMCGAEDVAKYYIDKRGIPESHLMRTSLSLKEVMSREEFEKKVQNPIRKKIKELKGKSDIYGIVLIYGVPLKVLPPVPDWDVKDTIFELKREQKWLTKKVQHLFTNQIDLFLSFF